MQLSYPIQVHKWDSSKTASLFNLFLLCNVTKSPASIPFKCFDFGTLPFLPFLPLFNKTGSIFHFSLSYYFFFYQSYLVLMYMGVLCAYRDHDKYNMT